MKTILIFFILSMFAFTHPVFSQANFLWTELTPMPEFVSNNAVAAAHSGDTICIYSFSGIDSTKTPNGIHNKGFKYNLETEEWTALPPLPDGMTRIAAGASTVNNKIYIIGGYHVFPNFNEESLNFVHVFDPETNTYLPDATPVPTSIDDHVQAVWRDSLIFVVTGWSQNTNVPNVQIYNPALNEWATGTPVPNNTSYKAFGASGDIVGDTIYYNGGAVIGSNFPGTTKLRKGVINPDNPSEITWSIEEENPGAKGYRMGAKTVDDRVYWIGGGGQTYNFDGVAYNGSGIVEPLERIMEYNATTASWTIFDSPKKVMDFRGVAKISENELIICGGMTSGAEVSNAVYMLAIDFQLSVSESENKNLQIWPVPATEVLHVKGIDAESSYQIIDTTGKIILSGEFRIGTDSINTSALTSGNYILMVRANAGETRMTFTVM
jgi:N-acetylneuraminic acid mutarotase